MGLPLAKLHAVAAGVGPLAGRVRTFFLGGEQGVWYDPSDLSTMFQASAASTGEQVPITATGQSVGLILDKRLGLALGSPASSNMDFATAGTGWFVFNEDGTHIVTFGTGSCRFQSDTTTPALRLDKASVYTAGLWYRIDVTLSAHVSGTIKITGGAFEVIVPGSVGTHSLYFLASATTFSFTRNSTNVDLTIASFVVRPVAGNHAYQTTTGLRPIYRNVNSTHYLEFDGVDDFLRSTFTITQPLDRVSSIRQVTWNASDRIFADVTGTAGGILFQRFAGVTPEVSIYDGTAVTMAPHLALGVNGVVTERHAGASSKVALNSGDYVTGNAGTAVPGGITIGANDVGTQAATFHLHQLVERGGPTALTDTQIAYARALSTLKAGLIPSSEILKLFAAGQQGAWYDPSDLSTLFQGGQGQAPVTATGQIVGTMLDKSKNLVFGAPLVYESATVLAGSAVDNGNGTWTLGASSTLRFVYPLASLTNGYSYKCEFTASGLSGTTVVDWCNVLGLGVTAGAYSFISKRDTYDSSYRYINFTTLAASGATITVPVLRHLAGNHAYQLTSGSRPVFRDLLGLRYLEFDGVDDFMQARFTIVQPIDRISAIKQISWTNADRIFCGGSAISSTLQQAGSSPFLVLYTGTANLVMDPSPAIDTAGVLTERHSGATSRVAFNNNAYDIADTGTLAPGGITIGARYDGASAGNFHLYQAVMRGSTTEFSDDEITLVKARCQQKSGAAI